MRTVRVGCGSANERDRPELAQQMIERGDLAYLGFDNLAERTLAFAQLRELQEPGTGHNPLLAERMRLILPRGLASGVRMAGNMGAANPARGAEVVHEVGVELGLPELSVAVVLGDDVLDLVRDGDLDLEFWETGSGIASLPGTVVSANAYLGAEPILRGLEAGADVVVTGRCADLSPYVAMLVHEFGWALDDWEHLAAGAVVGHLLECGRYVTGGAFVDPAYGKTVDGLDDLAFPLCEVRENGTAVLTKPNGTGGEISVATAKEQLLHEIHDPSSYLSPDVTLDMTGITARQVGPDRVEVQGARGRQRPETYKVVVGVDEGWIAEGEISFPGPGCVEKARQSAGIVRSRLARAGVEPEEIRVDLIGLDSIFGSRSWTSEGDPPEVRLRIAGRAPEEEVAVQLARECEDLWFGPISGGGVRTSTRRVVGMYSTLVPRELVPATVRVLHRSDQEVVG